MMKIQNTRRQLKKMQKVKIFRDLKTGKLLQVITEGLPSQIQLVPNKSCSEFKVVEVAAVTADQLYKPLKEEVMNNTDMEKAAARMGKQETIRMGIIATMFLILVLGMTALIKDCQLKKMDLEIRKLEAQSTLK